MTDLDPGSLIEANRRRARLRRRLLWIVVPLAAVALILPAKIVSMYAFAHRSITAHVAGNDAGAVSAAQGQEILNLLEPYKAPYNVGVGLAESFDLGGARARFEQALGLNPPGLEVCAVAINLGITIERQGDAAKEAGDQVSAEAFYGEALAVVADIPEDCHSDEADQQSPDQDRSSGQSIDDLEDRLKQKQQPPQPNPTPTPSQDPNQPDEDQPSDEQLDELQDKLEQGEGERRQYQGDDDGQGDGGAEKPW